MCPFWDAKTIRRLKGVLVSRLRLMAAAAIGMSMLASLVPSPAHAVTTPWSVPPPHVTVALQAANGSGCPVGSTSVVNAPSGEAFTLLYSMFLANGGQFKNCQVVVKVGVPAGWTYAIYEVDNRGYALLDETAIGSFQMTSYFTGYPGTVK